MQLRRRSAFVRAAARARPTRHGIRFRLALCVRRSAPAAGTASGVSGTSPSMATSRIVLALLPNQRRSTIDSAIARFSAGAEDRKVDGSAAAEQSFARFRDHHIHGHFTRDRWSLDRPTPTAGPPTRAQSYCVTRNTWAGCVCGSSLTKLLPGCQMKVPPPTRSSTLDRPIAGQTRVRPAAGRSFPAVHSRNRDSPPQRPDYADRPNACCSTAGDRCSPNGTESCWSTAVPGSAAGRGSPAR